jgi:hydroxymethylglutaryl-CoA lyase
MFPKKVTIVEVGPRDGLQNEKINIPTEIKIDFINKLSETGLKNIEVTSFVSPKRIPQLSDSTEVFSGIQKKSGIVYSALVPNVQGMEKALACDVKQIAVFTTVSETFSQKNTHCNIAESLNRIGDILQLAKPHAIPVRAYISCVLGCPYEGEMSVASVVKLAQQLMDMGCYEISLGDTIGVGTPGKAKELVAATASSIPIEKLAVHFHDTYGQALANIYACLELGVSVIDSAVGGLGGCPYAKGASGNVATEDVLYLLQGLGIETGIDMDALLKVSQFVSEMTGHPPRSKVAQAKS